MKNRYKIGLGGGCHWCTEAVFQAIPGVLKVEQGYISSKMPYDSMSEAVIVHFSTLAGLEQLIDVHLETHASTRQHSRRDDYRSAVYFFDVETEKKVKSIISKLSRKRNNHKQSTFYNKQVFLFQPANKGSPVQIAA